MPPEDEKNTAAEKPPLNPAIWIFFLGALQLTSLFLPIPNRVFLGLTTIGITVIYIGLIVGLATSIARLKLPLWVAGVGVAGAALAWLGIQYGMLPTAERFGHALARVEGDPTPIQSLAMAYPQVLQDLALITGAMFAGSAIARLVRHPNLVGPIGVMVALIDTWGVLFGGIVHQLTTNQATKPLAAKAMASGPHIGAAAGGGHFTLEIPDIGVGDYLFIALLLCILVNLSMNWKTTSQLMWGGIAFALLGMIFIPAIPALPGLVFIGGAAVLPNIRYFKFTRDEKFALLYAGIFVIIMTAVLYFYLTSKLPPSTSAAH